MCSINGFTFRDEGLIAKMNSKTKHRGPDATGQYVDSKVSLGHNRLAILDLTPTGAQPMKSDDGSVVIVFNGEIYNFQELRKELEAEGQKFKGTSDTEVIVRGYETWGIEVVKKFNGIFAFALWDSKKEKLFLVRDQIGVKPLYYAENNGALIFSSEIKAILEHPIKREINHEAFNIYFRVLYVPAPITMFNNILKLEPGHILTYEHGVIKKESYWNPTLTAALSSKEEAKDLIKKILKDSVQRQMISERPVGVFLSGGVDSTVILGLAAEVSGKTLDTFSVGFETGGDKFNADARLARLTSEYYHTRHHELIIKNSDVREYLPEVIYHMDEPVANATQVATYLLSRFTRDSGIVVALGGDGGDELFGGYERYRLSQMISFYQGKIPVLTQSFLGRFMKWLPKNFREEVEMMTKAPGAPRLLAFMAQKETEISGIFKSGINDTDVTTKWFERYFQPLNPDTENAFMMADIQSWLTDESLIRSDKLSMAWALEHRVPILDYRLVELSGKIPSSWKFDGKSTKKLFKEAIRSYLPDHIINEPKRGWASPASEWLRYELKDLMIEAMSPGYAPATEHLFDLSHIQQMYFDHVERRAYHMNVLWAFLTFQIWSRKFLS